MAGSEWYTFSVRLNEELRNAVNLYCKREKITPNKFIRTLLERELSFILKPDVLAENQGVPQIGENNFKYMPETDNFVWQLDLGTQGVTVLSENVLPTYLQRLDNAIKTALSKREKFQSKMKNSKVVAVVPSKIMRYGVRKNVINGTKIKN